ncbi:MAG: hypothetical protein IKF17_01630 [Clostridia bacterium]|nr:hypothetical protein [Clostridia bacterium]
MSTKITMETVEKYVDFLNQANKLSDFDRYFHLFKEAVWFFCNNPNGEFAKIYDLIVGYKMTGVSTPVIEEVIESICESEQNARFVAEMIVRSEETEVTSFELFKLQLRIADVEKVISGIRKSVN